MVPGEVIVIVTVAFTLIRAIVIAQKPTRARWVELAVDTAAMGGCFAASAYWPTHVPTWIVTYAGVLVLTAVWAHHHDKKNRPAP